MRLWPGSWGPNLQLCWESSRTLEWEASRLLRYVCFESSAAPLTSLGGSVGPLFQNLRGKRAAVLQVSLPPKHLKFPGEDLWFPKEHVDTSRWTCSPPLFPVFCLLTVFRTHAVFPQEPEETMGLSLFWVVVRWGS